MVQQPQPSRHSIEMAGTTGWSSGQNNSTPGSNGSQQFHSAGGNPGGFNFGPSNVNQFMAGSFPSQGAGSKRDRSLSPNPNPKRSRNGTSDSTGVGNPSVFQSTATSKFGPGTPSTPPMWLQGPPTASPSAVGQRRKLPVKGRLKARQTTDGTQTTSSFRPNPLRQGLASFMSNPEHSAFSFSAPMSTTQNSMANADAAPPNPLLAKLFSSTSFSSNPLSNSNFHASTSGPLFFPNALGNTIAPQINLGFATTLNNPIASMEQSSPVNGTTNAVSPDHVSFFGSSFTDSLVRVKQGVNQEASFTGNVFEVFTNGGTQSASAQSTNSPFAHLSFATANPSESGRRDSPFAHLSTIPSAPSSMTLNGDKQQNEASDAATSFDSNATIATERIPSPEAEQIRLMMEARRTARLDLTTNSTGSTSSKTPQNTEIATPKARAPVANQKQAKDNLVTAESLGNLREKLNAVAKDQIAGRQAEAGTLGTKPKKSVSFELPPTAPLSPPVLFNYTQAPSPLAAKEEENAATNIESSHARAEESSASAQDFLNLTAEMEYSPPASVTAFASSLKSPTQAPLSVNRPALKASGTNSTAPTTKLLLAELLNERAEIDAIRISKRSSFLNKKAEYEEQKYGPDKLNDKEWQKGVENTWRVRRRIHNEDMLDLAADRERVEEQLEEVMRKEAKKGKEKGVSRD
ncbi:MAG: hypothetical protein MMC33_009010 [Icmadophila ericetorum]|nr:hypothetical protein [Icmadophila ericetorum]